MASTARRRSSLARSSVTSSVCARMRSSPIGTKLTSSRRWTPSMPSRSSSSRCTASPVVCTRSRSPASSGSFGEDLGHRPADELGQPRARHVVRGAVGAFELELAACCGARRSMAPEFRRIVPAWDQVRWTLAKPVSTRPVRVLGVRGLTQCVIFDPVTSGHTNVMDAFDIPRLRGVTHAYAFFVALVAAALPDRADARAAPRAWRRRCTASGCARCSAAAACTTAGAGTRAGGRCCGAWTTPRSTSSSPRRTRRSAGSCSAARPSGSC